MFIHSISTLSLTQTKSIEVGGIQNFTNQESRTKISNYDVMGTCQAELLRLLRN